MASFVDSVVVDQFGIRSLRPTPRRLILFARKDGDGHGYLDAFDVEETALEFPVEARRGHPGVGQPIERDVVENLVTCQFADGARGAADPRHERGRWLPVSVTMVEQIRGEADRRISKCI